MNLKDRRLELHLSQVQLARMANISQSILSDYENGRAQMTANNIIALAIALRCTTDYLLGLATLPTDCRKIALL